MPKHLFICLIIILLLLPIIMNNSTNRDKIVATKQNFVITEIATKQEQEKQNYKQQDIEQTKQINIKNHDISDVNNTITNNENYIHTDVKIEEKTNPELNVTTHKKTSIDNSSQYISNEDIDQLNKTKEKTQNETAKLVEINEELDWSKWRSNLANQIIKISNAYGFDGSAGVIYEISFNVDKNKVITGTSIDIYYKPIGQYAEPGYNAIRKAIDTINGTDILTFPSRTQRTSTNFKTQLNVVVAPRGKLNIKYATPQHFPDIEYIKYLKKSGFMKRCNICQPKK